MQPKNVKGKLKQNNMYYIQYTISDNIKLYLSRSGIAQQLHKCSNLSDSIHFETKEQAESEAFKAACRDIKFENYTIIELE